MTAGPKTLCFRRFTIPFAPALFEELLRQSAPCEQAMAGSDGFVHCVPERRPGRPATGCPLNHAIAELFDIRWRQRLDLGQQSFGCWIHTLNLKEAACLATLFS